MKNVYLKLLFLFTVALGVQSCKSSQQLGGETPSLNGAWEITELQGGSVVPGDRQPFPFIDFNIIDGRFHGSSGCNNMMGSFTLDAKKGKLSFGKTATTLMACPDMEIESKVLKMIEEVDSFKEVNSNQVALYGKGKDPIAILTKKADKSIAELLTSKWGLVAMGEKDLEIETKGPFISFDGEKMQVSGSAGCNSFFGDFELPEDQLDKIEFGALGVTRKFCRNMQVENAFLKALNETVSFKFSENESLLIFYNTMGEELLRFVKVTD